MRVARIVGTGRAVPAKVFTNPDLERLVDTSDEWITTRTGIKERRIAGREAFPISPSRRDGSALEMAGMSGSDIEL